MDRLIDFGRPTCSEIKKLVGYPGYSVHEKWEGATTARFFMAYGSKNNWPQNAPVNTNDHQCINCCFIFGSPNLDLIAKQNESMHPQKMIPNFDPLTAIC